MYTRIFNTIFGRHHITNLFIVHLFRIVQLKRIIDLLRDIEITTIIITIIRTIVTIRIKMITMTMRGVLLIVIEIVIKADTMTLLGNINKIKTTIRATPIIPTIKKGTPPTREDIGKTAKIQNILDSSKSNTLEQIIMIPLKPTTPDGRTTTTIIIIIIVIITIITNNRASMTRMMIAITTSPIIRGPTLTIPKIEMISISNATTINIKKKRNNIAEKRNYDE